MDKRVLWILFLVSSFTFAQTTVTLEDQCNCEVLQGTDVSAPGVTTPGGADLGDLYVNTTTGTIFFWDGDSWELTTAANTDNQQLQNFTFDAATNILSLDLQNGGTVTVNLSDLQDTLVDTNTTNNRIEVAGPNLVITDSDNNIISIPLADIAAQVDTNTTITSFAIDGSNTNLVLTDSDSNSFSIPIADIASLVNTDNQNLENFQVNGANLELGIVDGNVVSVPLADITAGVNTDDQALSLAAGNILTLEDGGTVDLTPYLDNTDDQQITAFSLDNTTNILTLTLENGGTQTVDLSGVSTDDQTATEVSVTDAAGNFTATDVEGALAELATGSTDDQALSLAAGNILTLEDGGTVDLTPYLDNTDDQQITAFSLDNTTNILTLTLENGGTQTVDFSTVLASAGTDDQALSLAAGNILTLEDGGTVDLTPYLDNTDDQQITAFSLDNTTNILTLTLENGGTQTVDLSGVSTDDQTATEVSVTDAAGNFTATDVEGALAELATGSTDDQALSLAAGNILTLEDGGTVDLTPYLDNTDDQQITAFSLDNTTNILTLTLENGGTQTVDFSTVLASAGTDDQALSLAAGNILTLEDGGTVDLTPYLDNTDDQQITAFSLDNTTNILTLTLENGGTQTVDLSGVSTDDQTATEVSVTDAAGNFTATDVEGALAELATGSTDDQALSLAAGNILTLEDGGTVDLTPYLDNTDDQQITAFSLDNTTNILTLTLENGGTQTVDLSGVSTDDQTATEVSVTDAAGNFTATDVEGALAELATGSTDDQALSLAAGNILTLEDGGTVDLTPYLDNTDDQQITAFSLDNTTNILTLTLENGGTQTVDFSTVLAAAGTDDQTISTDGTSGNLSVENGNTITLNVNDADSVIGNEYNTGSGITAGSVQITDGGGTESVNLISTDANNDISSGTDGALYLNVASVTISETNTTLGFNGATNELTYTNELGNNPVLDLSAINTDDQTATEVSVTDAAGNFTATDVEGALAELATGSTDDQALSLAAGNILTLEDGGTVDLTPYLDNTDDQQITAFSLDNTTNILTLTLENGGTQTVDLSGVSTDDQTATEVSVTDAADNFTATDVEGALAELATGSTDDQALSLAAGNILTLEDGGTVDLTPYLDNTDDQQITAFSLDNTTNILTLTLENGGTQTVDLSGVSTDDQTATEVSVTDAAGNFTATDVEGALAELATGSTDDQALSLAAGNILTLEDGGTVDLTPYLDNTDDQQITAFSLDNTTNILTLTLENGGTQTVDFSTVLAAAGTDDQTISTDGTSGNLSVENGNTITLNVNDADSVIGNEYNTGSGITAGSVQITDGGGTESVNLISTDANNDISSGTDGALYLNVASVTISETNTTLGFNGATNELTYTNELGNNPVLDLSAINTDDQTATEVSVTDAAGNFTATDVEGALAELATGSTDDQALSLAAGNILTLEDGGTVDLTPYLDNTDDQQITAFSLDNTTNILTLTLENGGTQTVDLSGVSTDDQTATEVSVTDAADNFTATDVEGALAELATGSTDDQALSLAAGNILTLEDGGTVDLTPYLDNTDDQQITAFSLDNTTNILTLTLENGGTQTVDLSGVSTDDQTATEVSVTDAAGNFTATDVEGALAELATGSTDDQALSLAAGNILTLEDGGTVDLTPYLDNTDDQQITAFSLDNTTNILTLTLENGGTQTVDFSTVLASAGTDDQALSLAAGNILTLEDGGTVDLTPYLDNTDDQQITAFSLDNTTNILTLTLENGGTQTVDFSTVLAAAGTDDQALSLAAGNILTLEDGGTVDLTPYLDNTDDQQITAFSLDNTTNILTLTLENGGTQTVDFSTVLASAGTDDQALSLAAGNILTLEDGGTVDLTPYLDNTDDQQITAFSLDNTTNILTLTLENGGTQTVDLSGVSTDDQTATEVSVTDAAGNFTATDVEGALAELATGSTDDQALSLAAGNILTLEDGGTVDLTPYLDNTDDQQITAFSLDNTTNILTLTLENGGTQTVDFSTVLASAGTDDQALSLAAGNILTLEDGGTVDLTPYLDNTDDQQITAFSLDNTTNILTLTLENGGTQTVDLSGVSTDDQTATEVSVTDAAGNFTATDVEGALAELATGSTDDQALSLAAGNILTLEDGGTVDLTPYLDNTDDQQITAFSLDNTTNILTLTLENGGTQTVDFSTVLASAGTDDQALSLAAGNILTLEDGGTVDLTPYLDNTDDQQITAFSLDNTTDVLTLTLENGGTQTVDFSTVLAAAGTDDQALSLAAGNILTLEDGGTVDLTPYLDNTDDQQITAFSLDNTTNILTLTLENGGTQTVDLSGVSTDDQTATEVSVTDAAGNFTATDVEGALAELATGSTDDQALSLAAGNILTLEDGGTVDLTPYLDNTDDQQITAFSLDNTTNILTLTLENGGTQTVDFSTVLASAGTDDQALSLAAGNILTLEDGGTVDLTPYLDNTDDQQITAFSLDNTTNILTLTLENGGTQTVDLSGVSTDDQTATEVSVTDAAGNFTATDVEGALAELATGSTDDQALSLAAGNILTLEDGGTVDLTPYLDNTDDQQITAFSLDNTTNILTLTLENGGTQTVDLSGVSTDDQTATEVSVTDAAGNFTATDVEGALAELATGSTDDQALSLAAGNILTLEDGGTVDLTPYLDNTDDQQITAFSLDNTTNILTLTLENGGTQTVDFSTVLAAAGTDDQALSLAAGNILTLEDGGTVDLTPYLDNTDDQTATEVSVTDAAGNFTATDVEGALAELATGSTDDQALSLAAGNILTLEDGGTVDLTPYLDNTDDQQITAFSLDNTTNILTLTLENGGTQTVDFSTVLAAAGTDDQALSLAAGNILTLEDGGTVDLTPYLDNTDDQTATEVSVTDAAGNFTATDVEGALAELATGSTDDQALSLAAGNILTLEDGGTVDLTPYLDNTDDQQITAFSLDNTTNILTLTLENGGTQTVDFSTVLAAAGTDDQALSLAAGNILTLEDGGTVDLTPYLDNTDDQQITAFSLDNTTDVLTLTLENGGTQTVDFTTVLAAAGTDDQALSLAAGNLLTLEDGGTVDLTPYLDNTDDQQITAFSLDNTTNILTLTLENGGTQTVDLSGVSTDDQTATEVSVTDAAGNFTATDVEGALAELATGSTDDQALSLAAGNILTLEDGGTVDLTPYLDNTDDQQITAFSLDNTTNILTLTLENGGTQTVDFSTVLAAAGTDDQALSLAAGNILTLEDGGTVDLTPYLDNTDDQTATEVSVTDAAGNFTATDVEGALAELATGSTDDQALSLAAGNILTLEDGGTVDLTPYLDNTDDQQITAFSLDNTTDVLTLTLENGGTQTVDFTTVLAAAGTDNQTLTLAGNTLSISDGNSVDITALTPDGDAWAVTGEDVASDIGRSGNVGVGTTTPRGALELSKAPTQGVAARPLSEAVDATTAGNYNLVLSNSDNATIGMVSGFSSTFGGFNTYFQTRGLFANAPAYSLLLNPMGGNVGIGTETATQRLQVNGSQTFTADGDFLRFPFSTEVDFNDGKIGASLFTEGLNIVGVQTVAGNGRKITTFGDVNNQNFVGVNNVPAPTVALDVNGQGLFRGGAGLADFTATATQLQFGFQGTDTFKHNIRTRHNAGLESGNAFDFYVWDQGNDADGDLGTKRVLTLDGEGANGVVDVQGNLIVRDLPAGLSTDALVTADVDGNIRKVNSLKASKVFYPPSIAIDASVTGTFTVDLYAQYIAQFGSPVVSSGGTIPTYGSGELDYHVTYADPAVFNTGTMAISPAGVLTYTVDAPPADYNSLINVVFVVK
ncbi:hypothetical protein EJ994_01690 [Maribacter sp. MJ134]|uniref:hypothetical protein n=1 Tax=Maribacter sp. MJ134 TaxID=2496865 RepID=UPI000F825F34|nr:hypothetical protein [Maribacter sp. MJ134]AZQ57576.1 hypothetical protein EJ994_01690 [Maribacter sp. MJ134]